MQLAKTLCALNVCDRIRCKSWDIWNNIVAGRERAVAGQSAPRCVASPDAWRNICAHTNTHKRLVGQQTADSKTKNHKPTDAPCRDMLTSYPRKALLLLILLCVCTDMFMDVFICKRIYRRSAEFQLRNKYTMIAYHIRHAHMHFMVYICILCVYRTEQEETYIHAIKKNIVILFKWLDIFDEDTRDHKMLYAIFYR